MTQIESLEATAQMIQAALPSLMSGAAVKHAYDRLNHIYDQIDCIKASQTYQQWTTSQPPQQVYWEHSGEIQLWPINQWQPGDGLMVWDGEIRHECQAVPIRDGKVLAIMPMRGSPWLATGFICGKCHGRTWDDSMLLLKPGDVCAVCFSVAIGKEPRDPFAEQMERMRHTVYETIDLSPHPPFITHQTTMTKEEFAKHYPNAKTP